MRKTLSGNPTLIRDINRANVLDMIRREGPVSQTAISKLLSLQPSTILRIVNDLIDEELVVQKGMGQSGSKGGRRAALLELNPKGAYAIGVDLGSEEIIAVVIDLAGSIVCEARKELPAEEGAERVMANVKAAIGDILASPGVPADKVLGIGVSIPGKVDSVTGVSIYAINLKNWNRVPVAEELEAAFRLPVYVEHDIRSMAFGEMWFDEQCQNMICMGFRGGIGLGLVLNGELYQGANQFAGDVGHVVVDPEGPICNCGRRGCLEAMASEKAILSKFRKYKSVGASADGQPAITVQDVLEAMEQGDQEVLEWIREAAGHMGKVLSDLVRVFDPEKIIIGGNCIAASPEFLRAIRLAFRANQPNYADPDLDVDPAHFGDACIAIGSASIILSSLFKPSGMSHNILSSRADTPS